MLPKVATGVQDPVTSTLHVILGETTDLSCESAHNGEKLLRYSLIGCGYGFSSNFSVIMEENRHRNKAIRGFLACKSLDYLLLIINQS